MAASLGRRARERSRKCRIQQASLRRNDLERTEKSSVVRNFRVEEEHECGIRGRARIRVRGIDEAWSLFVGPGEVECDIATVDRHRELHAIDAWRIAVMLDV